MRLLLVVALASAFCFSFVSADSLLDYLPQSLSSNEYSSNSPAMQYPSSSIAQPPPRIRSGGICRDVVAPWACPEYEYYPVRGLEFREYFNASVAFCTEIGPPGGIEYSIEPCYTHVDFYFHGHNHLNLTIPRGAPVLIQATAIGVATTLFTTMFFLPSELARDPPRPTNPRVRVDVIPVAFIAAMQFGPTPFGDTPGWFTDFRLFDTASALELNLFTHGVRFDNQMFVYADYNVPGTLANRRREIWYALGPRTEENGHSLVNIKQELAMYQQGTLKIVEKEASLQSLSSPQLNVAAPPLGIPAGGHCRDIVANWSCPRYEYFPRFGLEFRQYENVTVAFAAVQGPPGRFVESIEYLWPFVAGYFNGENRENRTIEMSTPVLFQVTNAGPSSSYYTAIFFLPRDVVPPTPLNRTVQVDRLPLLDIAAYTFAPTSIAGGNATIAIEDAVLYDTARGLEVQLFQHGIPFIEELFLFAAYDPPMARENRRHELWYALRRGNATNNDMPNGSIVRLNKEAILHL